ncbi:sn-glycerol-1-phosphate dehydrogenase [Clostridium beijerinckii]|uniref:Sn-glycerol-1-phosphate dehydrogenase n=2 Tax=Clostridium beijerinckii TaxID=1520 RepID=A0AAE2UZF9_CLOBE|nr:sn-glycerol-1-phosphate dehydrogenase [Clostridium beijerinckii]ABR34524.1 Glycerol-1-phosphate dehydrogenase (NAD(P)(+)) [Clostridium beijerinckii NCIMB 8052]AIU01549.1 glycerol-1-phosphate dehydrogenase (NAD(P)(+)) [Clostridium beijerinckii ATCC 35702]MBF7810850.1 sn-glycerol-1-phosphate dehydrogenase [Clostridium beijerinckii]NRT24137.1 glycerol-1-phosphate dehydrogenase [NAD(P)+] [Clostridium beijerinckii]NRT68278.1 glycerol-1-phosphate dehydrogenase [NAD(P)+] [Clostridium beijerinckii]
MNEILTKTIEEMADMEFDCGCGKKHRIDIKHIYVGENVYNRILDVAKEILPKEILLVSDNNTYKALGKCVENELTESGYKVNNIILVSDGDLIPDEKAIGRLLVEVNNETELIVAVGSGSINDICRIISAKTHIPYVIMGTAPSMDGYASTVSPLIIDGAKVTYPGTNPYAIIADSNIMKDAPFEMICAGFGDILGKYTALSDWRLSNTILDEYFCDTTEKLVRNAMYKCFENIEGAVKRDVKAIEYISEALILSGIAMTLSGNSRPASGAEHHLSHYWEIDKLSRKLEHPLHGNSVGVGTVISAWLYKKLNIEERFGIETPVPEIIINLLNSIGAKSNPKALGIEKELFHRSVIHALEIRPRYTILQYAKTENMLEEYANELTNLFYGE